MAESHRIEELRRRVQSDPASIAFAALAEEYRRAGRYQDAIDTCRNGLQRHPSYISAHVTLGRALLEVGDYDAAQEQLELVLRVAPENLAAIRGLADIHHRRGDTSGTRGDSAAGTPETSGAADTPAAPQDWGQPAPAAAPEPHRAEAAPAPVPVVPHYVQPAEDRALAGLEEFLAAIIRARKAAGGIHVP